MGHIFSLVTAHGYITTHHLGCSQRAFSIARSQTWSSKPSGTRFLSSLVKVSEHWEITAEPTEEEILKELFLDLTMQERSQGAG